jgi:hypothetical protein
MRRTEKKIAKLPTKTSTNMGMFSWFCLVIGCTAGWGMRVSAESQPVDAEPIEEERLIHTRVSDVVTLPKGRSQVDWMFFFQDLDHAEAISNALGIRHGLTDRVEVGAFLWHTWMEPFTSDSFGGFNDSTLYAKYALVRPDDSNDFPLDVTVGGMFFVPTGSVERGFGFGEPYFGGFVAISKPLGSITLQAIYERVNMDGPTWRDFNAWGAAAFYHVDRLRTISLEVAGNEKRQEHGGDWLAATVGLHLAHPRLPMITRVGLIAGMNDAPYQWAVAFGLSFGL